MKFCVQIGLASLLLLGACTTYPVLTEVDVAALDEEASADMMVPTREQIDYVDDDRIICKRTIITGSRFKHKVCMSWFEWKEVNQRGKDYTDDIQTVSTQVNNS